MTTVLPRELTLTVDQLRAAAARVGVQDLPTVLMVRSGHVTIDTRDAAMERAISELSAGNLIADGELHPDLVSILQALHRPDRELAMRLVTPAGTARISIVRQGPLCVLVRRVGEDICLRYIGRNTELPHATRELLIELPKSHPAKIQPFGAPLHEMYRILTGTHDPVHLGDRIRALGAEPKAAMLLGSAFGSRQAFAETVYSALGQYDGRITRGPAAVALFYTERGRVISTPSASPDGQLWSTLKPGSDHAFGQAVGQLVELAHQEWVG